MPLPLAITEHADELHSPSPPSYSLPEPAPGFVSQPETAWRDWTAVFASDSFAFESCMPSQQHALPPAAWTCIER